MDGTIRYMRTPEPAATAAPTRATSLTAALLAAAIATASLVAHTWHIAELPSGFYVDESSIAWNAHLIAESGRDPSRRDLLDSLLHSLSCQAAVKAGQRLSLEEIDSLLAQRHLIDDAHHCPHGRPTALVLSRSELDRQFGRLGS